MGPDSLRGDATAQDCDECTTEDNDATKETDPFPS